MLGEATKGFRMFSDDEFAKLCCLKFKSFFFEINQKQIHVILYFLMICWFASDIFFQAPNCLKQRNLR